MEEGTGISLYILVGIIIFGLFVSLATLFGTELHAQSSNIIACVQSYISDEPTDCGESDPNDLEPPITTNDIRYGPTPNEWYVLDGEQRKAAKEDYLQAIEQDNPNLKDTEFYAWANKWANDNRRGYMYGVYDDEGQLIKVHSLGYTEDENNTRGVNIRVNDARLVPDEFKKKANEQETSWGVAYTYENEQGISETYYVFTQDLD